MFNNNILKRNNVRKVLTSFLIILTIFMVSCSTGGKLNAGAGAAKIAYNDEIDKETLDSIKVLDDKVLDGIKNNDPDKILEISSKLFKDKSSNINDVLINSNKLLNDMSFEYKDRYYAKVDSVGNFNFTITGSEEDPFHITLQAVSKDIFVSMLKTTSNKHDYLVVLIYIKENGEWKLATLNVGDYSEDGMNAVELYEKAKTLESAGYKLPANIYMGLSSKVLRPVPYIQYKKESEIKDFNKNLVENINKEHSYPEKLKSINNAEIYGFNSEYTIKDGVIPVVCYVTSIDLGKKDELQKEANEMNKEVTDLYPGMKESFKYILYRAYSEPPTDPKKTYNYYASEVEQK